MSLINSRRTDSMIPTISLWDKLPKTTPVRMNIDNEEDFPDENDPTENETEEEHETADDEIAGARILHRRFGSSSNLENIQTNDDEIAGARTLHRRFESSSNLGNIQTNGQLWTFDEYDQIKVITDKDNIEEAIKILKRHLSNQNLRLIMNEKENEIRSWHFGLSFIRLKLEHPSSINIPRGIGIQSFPFWLRFKKQSEREQKRFMRLNSERIKPIRYGNSGAYRICLRYGAITELNQFYYSPEHSWSKEQTNRWSLFLNNNYSRGYIQWVIEESKEQITKQLLANNIDRAVIINLLSDGFEMYICQICNLNEFSAQENAKTEIKNSHHHSNSCYRRGPMRPSFDDRRIQQRSISNGIYFPTIQFELRINRNHLTKERAQQTVRQTYKLLTDFFTSHNITVCYGTINLKQGPIANSFPPIEFPSLIMRYSWQMLQNIGYRLQIQIDDEFCDSLFKLSREKYNADDLFYRVCVYLSRLFTFEPFVNLLNTLKYAVKELKRKLEDSSFELISTLKLENNKEAYIPSVTLTPTTIRIKPLKLCRTNRVLRAEKEFGQPINHFILVEIRDENGQQLQSAHFRDLHDLFLRYLTKGFTLMNNNRYYRYLHHSQSQLRARQFWFYHHELGVNLSFEDAYKWMGNFNQERNVAKNASRIALCFSTTIPTININDTDFRLINDIKTQDGKYIFTDGCGTMSEQLRDDIQKELNNKRPFSAIQFRFAGVKGVVSVDPKLGRGHHLCIRHSMNKFVSSHRCFEVCKVSAPRPLYLNQQAILLLSHRKISDAVFLTLQQRNHLTLIRALLRNKDAKNLLTDRLPYWFLPEGANIDFVHEPFFRQILIAACLISTAEILRKTRIRVPTNKARNMFGIIDEYDILEADQVFVQYTQLKEYDDDDDDKKRGKTQILDNCKVVITKNPCHHPGDIRTFTAVNHPALQHLKDVVVFSQRGNRPAPHQISGSDLDGDEYAVIWHENLVPLATPNDPAFNYDSQEKPRILDRPVKRDDINKVILEIAESDYLGQLCKLHLAYADKYGVNSNEKPPKAILSTIELAGAISVEVDSGKTGQHPLNENEIRQQNEALGKKRPDFMAKANMESCESPKILGQLYRSSRRMLPAWNQLLRKHRHLRHLQVRTPQDEQLDDEEDQQELNKDDDRKFFIELDPSLIDITSSNQNQEVSAIASKLFFVYRQEMLEILNLYGLSHESDLWCRKSTNNINSELEDTAYNQLEQLVERTRQAFFLRLISYCPYNTSHCNRDTPFEKLCKPCQNLHNHVAVALYRECYSGQNGLEQAPILSLPWLFTTALLKSRQRELASKQGLLSMAMINALNDLIGKQLLRLGDFRLRFRTSNNYLVEATVHWTVCVFIEIVHYCLKGKSFASWPEILSRFIRYTNSYKCETLSLEQSDQWSLVFDKRKQDDEYAASLISMEWTEDDDELMHNYFSQLVEICFDLGQSINEGDNEYLRISEEIILILQRVAIDETPLPKNTKKIRS